MGTLKEEALLMAQTLEEINNQRRKHITIHELKAWPDEFDAVLGGEKTADFRRNDRGFGETDLIILQAYVPTLDEWVGNGRDPELAYGEDYEPGTLTGEFCLLRITHIADASFGFGIPQGFVVLSVERVKIVVA